MQRVGGVSRYFYEIITRISKVCDVEICTKYLSNEYFSQILDKPKFKYSGFQHLRLQILLEKLNLYCKVFKGNFDLIHFTGYETMPFNVKKPVVITVHDMIAELFYKDSKRINQNRKAIIQADAIVCVSENTKQDLIMFYPEVKNKLIKVIYHGYTPSVVEYKKNIDGSYILFVGSRYGEYKNFLFFVSAISEILKSSNLKLVCVGSKFSNSELAEIKRIGVEKNIINIGFVSDSELGSLYHFAQCFVYPSLYEGFGIPILEAFSHDCPVCASEASCFPEVGGDAIAYFNPKDKNSISSVISKVISDKDLKETLVSKGRERMKLFSWDVAAQRTMDLYEEVINEYKSSKYGKQ